MAGALPVVCRASRISTTSAAWSLVGILNMGQHVTLEALRKVHQATPFRPFTLHLADGRRFRVPHREFLSHGPVGRTVTVYGDDDSFDILDLLLVTDLEVEPQAPSSRSQGS
jgi:hypothetical protein